jgi:hypothetical protein
MDKMDHALGSLLRNDLTTPDGLWRGSFSAQHERPD